MPRYGATPKQAHQDTGLLFPLLFVGGVFLIYMISRQNSPPSRTINQNKTPSSSLSTFYAPSQTSPSHTETPSTWTPFTASKSYRDGKYHLLLCATGSVAAIKIPAICSALSQYSNLSIRVVLSDSATQFLQGQSDEQPHWGTLENIENVHGVCVDRHEWREPWKRGNSILHIELRRWADLMVIAPLSANALAKMALGMSDTLVLSVARAWDTTGQIDGVRPGILLEGGAKRKTIMIAPAMNTAMFHHPATMKHLNVLAGEWGVQNGGWIELLAPIEKGLACGDAGSGGMKEWKSIVLDVERKFPKLKKEEGASGDGT